MINVQFHDTADDALLKFAVIISRYRGKWLFCRHRERDTYECPGGHREQGETILDTAKRELYEETGALEYSLTPVAVYSVLDSPEDGTGLAESSLTYGMLYFSEITALGPMPDGFEIGAIELFDKLPDHWTYPEIQPVIFKKVENLGMENLGI